MNYIKQLFGAFANMQVTQLVPFSSNDQKTEFPPFGRVDTACYPASLLGNA